MEVDSVPYALSGLFSGGRRRIKRMYSSFGCDKLQVQRAVPLGSCVL